MTALSLSVRRRRAQLGFVVSSCVFVVQSRLASSPALPIDAPVLIVWMRAFAVLLPRIIDAAPAPAAPPGTLTVFVASVGVSVEPDTVHGSVPPSGTVQTVPSH